MLTPTFKEVLPELLAIGMPYDVFWNDDADMVEVYIKAHRRKQEILNHNAWLSGAYNYNAVSVAVSNLFKKKGATPSEYLKEPIQLYKDEKKELSDAEKLYNKFKPVMAALNARRNRKG